MTPRIKSCSSFVSRLVENRATGDQICFRFIFTGDPEEAERSKVLDKLREDLENKKYLVDQFFVNAKWVLSSSFVLPAVAWV